MSSNNYYGTTMLFQFKHDELQQRYINHITHQKMNIYLFVAYFIIMLPSTPIVVQYDALFGKYGTLWIVFTVCVLIQLISYIIIIFIEIGEDIFYEKTDENIKLMTGIRRILITANNILSPFGMGLNLLLRSTVECGNDISVYETQFCNTSYNSRTVPIDCFISLMALTILHQLLLPTRFEYTLLSSFIGCGFTVTSIYLSYLHHQSDYASQTVALNCILCAAFVILVICQVFVQSSKIQQFVLQDGLDQWAALHRRRRDIALAVQELELVDIDDQSRSSSLFYHNLPPTTNNNTNSDNINYHEDIRDNASCISEITLDDF